MLAFQLYIQYEAEIWSCSEMAMAVTRRSAIFMADSLTRKLYKEVNSVTYHASDTYNPQSSHLFSNIKRDHIESKCVSLFLSSSPKTKEHSRKRVALTTQDLDHQ
jgi:hypothetical protein